MSDELFAACGGRKTVLMGADPDDPANVVWNFGTVPAPSQVVGMIGAQGTLWSKYPALKGKWDGRSTVNHLDAARRVLGDAVGDLIQQQPRGTCGGRAGSAGIDLVQCIMIAAGKRAKFARASHAAVYYAARRKYGMLNGSWTNDRNDGVASGSVPEVLSTVGVTQRLETGDLSYYGDGSDDLACQLGAGLRGDLAAKILELAADNVVTDWAPVESAAEAADGIAAGGILVGSDSQGFTMIRDADGFCRPSGTWHHYHVRNSVGVFNGRKGFGYFQSWGRNTPTGPLLAGHLGNGFGVDFEVQDRCIKAGEYAVIFGFPLWDLERGLVDVPWIFN